MVVFLFPALSKIPKSVGPYIITESKSNAMSRALYKSVPFFWKFFSLPGCRFFSRTLTNESLSERIISWVAPVQESGKPRLVNLPSDKSKSFTEGVESLVENSSNDSLEIDARDTSLDLPEGLGDVLDLAVQEHRLHGAVPFVLVDSIPDPAFQPESRFGFQCRF